ncbi:Cilia- and flagella-associated protein 299 [Frankliniella fusca]|uniref:Cilia- and flagella-associated protein 299 n=1 Tax=Frankliniella fusca TaxID=407009 RepID=A0AAE1H1A0_9NEOP|nr:Cilia- and flagella-associated protein 299 [Frankliniella fusca]
MSSIMREWQLEQDRRLMKFKTYEDYLDSLVADQDELYLRGAEARILAELGYRTTGDTLTRGQFHKRVRAATASLYPSRSQYQEDNDGVLITDPLLRELAGRERANRAGLLATIVHLQMMTSLGYEVSGYIDFADRLSREDWVPYFQGRRILEPNRSDLAFYHWRIDQGRFKSTPNFKVVPDPRRGLLFKHRKDRLRVCVDPSAPSPGPSTTRTRVSSPLYANCVIYDHVVRQRC